MPENRHFWQGVDVSWQGDVIDVMDFHHGGGIYFTDYRCGVNVRLDRKAVPSLYKGEDWTGHMAVAQFEVRGRLSYEEGEVVLRPDKLERISPWMTDEDFNNYMKKRRAALAQKGLLATRPE